MGVLKVYGMLMSTNTVRVVAAINEKGLEYELALVDLRTGAHKQPDFLALNPFGQIPVLRDGDVVLFESRAINRYLATKYKESGEELLLAGSAALEVWLEVESQQFGPAISELVFQLFIKPLLGGATDAAAAEAQAAKLAKVLDVYEERLAENKYLAGDEFTLADLNHMPYINYLMKTPKAELIAARPHVKAWWDAVSARPAWKKTAAFIPI